MQLSNIEITTGMTFSDGLMAFKKDKLKNRFEGIITINTIQEDENLSDEDKIKLINIHNSDINPFLKRLRIMRALDKEKEFSARIAIVLQQKNLSKMEMVKQILIIFRDEYTKKDILKKGFGEVLTPLYKVKEMVSEIEEDFWNSPYDKNGKIKTVLETSNGSGIFLWCVLYKFMHGLRNHFPNEEERYKFIIENMIYACELQKSKMFNWLCTADLYDQYDLNVYCGSYIDNGFDNHMKEVWGIEKFSLTISNPPYQEEVIGGSEKPLYNRFITKTIPITEKLLFIVPSRWFAGGKGLDGFRKMMLSRTDIKIIKHFDDPTKIFGNGVDIPGGVNYFLIDSEYNGKTLFNDIEIELNKYDILVRNVEFYKIIDKFSTLRGLDTICKGQSYSGINTNDIRLKSEKINDDYIKCYVSKINGYEKWINKEDIKTSCDYLTWKVITARANGENPKFGNKFIGKPGEVCNQSYIVFLVSTELESKSLLSYLNTKLVNKMLSIRKISQDIKPDTCKWIPIVPFDREWTDELLIEYFNLSEDEKEIIYNER
jgi:hypothetical protein